MRVLAVVSAAKDGAGLCMYRIYTSVVSGSPRFCRICLGCFFCAFTQIIVGE